MFRYIILLILISVSANAQEKLLWSIDKIELQDSILKNQIKDLIAAELKNDPVFKRGGYVNVAVVSISNRDTSRIYFINTNYDDKITSDGKLLYPHFYSIIHDRLICIYLEGLNDIFRIEFTPKSAKKFRKLLYNSLPYKSKLDQVFRLHGGTNIYILKNGTYSATPTRY